jgi:hypothetical protein
MLKRKKITVPEDPPDETPKPEARPLLRPKAFDAATVDLFCKKIRQGLPADGACDYVGVHYTTFQAWKTKGEAALRLEDLGGEGAALYVDFVMRFIRVKVRKGLSPSRS